MNNQIALIEAFEARARRREDRREFFRTTGAAAALVAGTSLLSACSGGGGGDNEPTPTPTPSPTPTPTPTPGIADPDILNFALNLEYLEAQFYAYAVTGQGIPQSLTTGTGAMGSVVGGRQVNFTDPVVRQYAREIAKDELKHVEFLRANLNSYAVAQPQINISGGPNGAFTAAARAAGLIGPNQTFDPYESDENFLLGAFIFEDVGVTAYKGAAPLLSNAALLEASAGILAAEAYHAGLIRTVLYAKGIQTPTLQDATVKISDARDSLDGPEDKDQGVIRGPNRMANLVPTDGNGIAFSRTAGEVLNIVYLNPGDVKKGGFFPAGVNGVVNTSDDNAG